MSGGMWFVGKDENSLTRIANALERLADLSEKRAIEAEARAASPSPAVAPLDVLRADVVAITSGYPTKDGKPLGVGGRAFEQCRDAVLRLIDRASPGLDVDRLARAIEAEDDRLPFLDAGIDSTASPRAVAEQIAAAYAEGEPTE